MALNIPTKINNTLDNYSLDANQVKGGYGVVTNFSDLASLPSATIVSGSLYYVTADNKFYEYSGTEWVQKVYTVEELADVVYSSDSASTTGSVQVDADTLQTYPASHFATASEVGQKENLGKVTIGGTEYTVRIGTEGASGYLTIVLD